MKYHIFTLTAFLIANTVSVNAQIIQKDNPVTDKPSLQFAEPLKASSITLHLSKVTGIGPAGYNSIETGTVDFYKNSEDSEAKEEYKGYPVMKNKPVTLTDVVEYCYLLDQTQFYFQNYVAGVYSKPFLLQKFKDLRKNIADTLKLSRKPLKCYISALAGFNANKEPFYIVDANNNGDYGDDTLKPLMQNVHDEPLTISSSTAVSISYLFNNQIKEDSKAVFIQQSTNPKKFSLTISFPEFSYLHFSYKGQPYIICADNNPYMPFCNILPDRPYFVSQSRESLKNVDSIEIASKYRDKRRHCEELLSATKQPLRR